MKNKFDLTGKTAIVTGGGSGIGRAIATTLAEQGATSLILDLSLEGAQSVVKEIEANGGKAEAYPCDVSDHENVKGAFSKALGNRSHGYSGQ